GHKAGCLVLKRSGLETGTGNVLHPCPVHHQQAQGTTAYLIGILPEAEQALNAKRLRENLGREFASDLRDKRYALTVVSGGRWEPVEPQRLRGLSVLSEVLPLEVWGNAVVDVRMLPSEASGGGVALYGRGGLRVCSLDAIEALSGSAWLDRRLEGYIRCERLKLTADKTALVQDGIYAQFIAAVHAAEPRLAKAIGAVANEHSERRLAHVTRRVDTLVERFLRHLEEGAPLRQAPRRHAANAAHSTSVAEPKTSSTAGRPVPQRRPVEPIHFRMGQPDTVRQDWQSWGNSSMEVVEINSRHPDFLDAEQDAERCSRYLFSLWAKEHLLAEYGSDSRKVAEVLLSWLNKMDPLLAKARER
ncbi:MAG: hypothetical protein HW397_371, partial [Dehalococcoidia bacterium]|nr:hypothetical protein [Dehalococcoidia bacterium]